MVRYYHPDEFAELKRLALARGFVHVESGPLVRSSYHAHEQADAFDAAGRTASATETTTATQRHRGTETPTNTITNH
jgi:lipoic acid synthetase